MSEMRIGEAGTAQFSMVNRPDEQNEDLVESVVSPCRMNMPLFEPQSVIGGYGGRPC